MAHSGAAESKPTGTRQAHMASSAADGKAGPVEGVSSYLAQASDVLTHTAEEVVQYQRNVMDGMAASWRHGVARRPGTGSYADAAKQWHEQTECIVTNMRGMSDAVRDCGWKLASLYAGAAEQASSQIQSLMPKTPKT